ncbi:MAG: hypothetical protein ACK5MY_06540 [Jhaorihella sp.]
MPEISKLAELRKLLLGMERAMGLQELSSAERDVFYAASDIAKSEDNIQTTGLMRHTLVTDISRPTFFRALRSLVEKGYLSHCRNRTRGLYVVNRRDG